MNKFKELGIIDEILKSIDDMGFDTPTDIQAQTIPLLLEGKDLIAGSATGSGKTLAFGSAIIQNIEKGDGIKALILTPTRELAEQILDMMNNFSKYKDLNVTSIYGGVAIGPQFKALEKADIVVGTPGRILDHLQRETLDLSNIRHLVLDEADRMLDMGFLDDVKRIMSQCSKHKQIMLFSATIPPEVEYLSQKFMNNPEKVSVNCYVDPKCLKQVYYDVKNNMKFSLLVHLLKQEQNGLVMVFSNSRRGVDIVAKGLNKSGIEAMAIHGGLTQNTRSNTITKFNSKKALVLVCTDVAARGLDIPGVTHVYNYDLPNDSKQYIHRIGRTARAGDSGKAISLLSDRDHDNFSRIQRDYDVDVKREEKPDIERVKLETQSTPQNRNTRFFGRDTKRSFRSNTGGRRRPAGNNFQVRSNSNRSNDNNRTQSQSNNQNSNNNNRTQSQSNNRNSSHSFSKKRTFN